VVRESSSRSVFVMSDQVDSVSAAALFRGGLLVLRPVLRTVVMAAASCDGSWPAQVADQVARLMSLASAQQPRGVDRPVGSVRPVGSGGPGVLVEVDRDEQFTMLLALAFHSTGVQGYGDYRACVFDGGDGGMSLWLCLTRIEHRQLCMYLTHAGADPEHLLG
jgi:hypothetical protein